MERNNIKKRAEVLGIITKILLFCCRGNTGKKQPLVFWVIFYMKVEQMSLLL
jgi:hypothetical protein